MDFLAAYSAVNQGHNHPRIAEALIAPGAQAGPHLARLPQRPACRASCEKLCTLTGFDKALPMNSGAEAVETAIKASRKWGYDVKGIPYPEAEIVVAEGNFHGRTTTIVGFSTDPDSHEPLRPVHAGLPHRAVRRRSRPCAAAITPKTCAVLVEPIQGEGGVIIPPKGYLAGPARDLRRRAGVLLILDEIQSGLGRTGKLFAFEHEGIRPDGVTIGKALSGGFYPVSAFLAKRRGDGRLHARHPRLHLRRQPARLRGGDRRARRAGRGEARRARGRARRRTSTRGCAAIRSPLVKEIRCLGLWAGVELVPEAGGARKYCYALKDRGLLCKDTHVNTIRLAPPLVITREQLDWAVDQIEAVLA